MVELFYVICVQIFLPPAMGGVIDIDVVIAHTADRFCCAANANRMERNMTVCRSVPNSSQSNNCLGSIGNTSGFITE